MLLTNVGGTDVVTCIAQLSGNRLHSYADNDFLCGLFEETFYFFGFSDQINSCMLNFFNFQTLSKCSR